MTRDIEVVDVDSFDRALRLNQTGSAENWFTKILTNKDLKASFSSRWLMKREEQLFSVLIKNNDLVGAERCIKNSLFASRKKRMSKRLNRVLVCN